MLYHLQHKFSLTRQRLLHLNAVPLTSLISSWGHYISTLLILLKPVTLQLLNLAAEGIIQNIFGQHITKSFFVLLLQSYGIPMMQKLICRTRQLAMLAGIFRSSDAGAFKPCYN